MTLSVGELVVNRQEEGCGDASQGAHNGAGESFSIASG